MSKRENITIECKTCQHYFEHEAGEYGECRRHAPCTGRRNRCGVVIAEWPTVEPNDKCGDYRGA
ncbi:MAG: hypothetical protein K9N51_06440 [Candidatus Pacebacteria bacterium]|nr:hypothetical protein [Candidatus Paceibacterota bacterium]